MSDAQIVMQLALRAWVGDLLAATLKHEIMCDNGAALGPAPGRLVHHPSGAGAVHCALKALLDLLSARLPLPKSRSLALAAVLNVCFLCYLTFSLCKHTSLNLLPICGKYSEMFETASFVLTA